MKKKIFLIIVAVLVFGMAINTYAEKNSNDITIYINGKKFSTKEYKVRNNRVIISCDSGIFEQLGCSVHYDAINHEVVVKNSDSIVTIFLNDFVIYRNGLTSYTADVRSDLVNKKIYIPLRGFIESLNYNVDWNEYERKIAINK